LIDLLRADEPRSWRFLDVTGVLERALPEMAEAMRRRRADMSDLDPLGALRFPTVDRLHQLLTTGEAGFSEIENTDELVLAALCADVSDEGDGVLTLAQRLTGDVVADRVAALVADAHLLRAGVRDPGAFDEARILQLATHLASSAHARSAYLLALASGELTTREREALDERCALVQTALEHPEVTGSEATNLAGARRAAAQHLLTDAAAIERLRFASVPYLLSHTPEDLARQARLVEPMPQAGMVRVAVSPQPDPDQWQIDVACRDTDGLLSRLTEVLAAEGLTVISADIATWPDGAVLDSFIVECPRRPSPRDLSFAFTGRMRGPVHRIALPELTVAFDNDALPWHTACVVTGPDRPGALQAVSAALTLAGVDVHTARIATVDGAINERFTVSDRFGRKIDAATMAVVRTVLAGGRRSRWRR
jgi:[protein-PII] uridylyltransferase